MQDNILFNTRRFIKNEYKENPFQQYIDKSTLKKSGLERIYLIVYHSEMVRDQVNVDASDVFVNVRTISCTTLYT